MNEDVTLRWVEIGFFTRVYYLFVVPFAIIASLNLMILLCFGTDTHYEVLVAISEFAVETRRELYEVLCSVLDVLPIAILVGYAIVGALPFHFRFWKFRKTPAGKFLKARARKNKSDISDINPDQVTVE